MAILKEKTLAVEVAHEAYRAAGIALRAAKDAKDTLYDDDSSTLAQCQEALETVGRAASAVDKAGMDLEMAMLAAPVSGIRTEGEYLDE
jgi:multidrug resistance efflux pump